MRQTLDQLAKSVLRALLRAAAHVETGLEIVGHVQVADLWVEPSSGSGEESSQPGILGRMLARGPCLIEPFSQTPRPRDIRACLCKQYSLDHAQTRDARREKRPPAQFPGLWIISPGQPRTVIEQANCHPMEGWPKGFWERESWDAFQIVVADALPRTLDTLPLRLLGRNTLLDALRELHELPESAWPKRLLVPVLIAFRAEVPQDPQEEEVMQTLQEIDAIYERWERQVKDAGRAEGRAEGREKGREEGREEGREKGRAEGREEDRRAVLLHLLGQRFGELSEDVRQQIRTADMEHLQRWTERVIPARVLADVFE